jgi:putative SOS response-associated peptidase YedK
MPKATGDLLSYFDAKEVEGTPPPCRSWLNGWTKAASSVICCSTLGFAGLYELWADLSLPEDDPTRWLPSCTVLTTTTQNALRHLHDRSPVILPRDRFVEWLDPDLTDKNDVQHLLDCLPEPILTTRIVSTGVNSVRNNGLELIEPVA